MWKNRRVTEQIVNYTERGEEIMGFLLHPDDSLKRMRSLLNYIYENKIELCIGFGQETGNCLSAESFGGMVKHVLGRNYDYILKDGEACVEIINTCEKYSLGTIYGDLPYGYDRGDTRSATLRFRYAISKNYLFVQDKRVARVASDRAVRYDGKGELFVIEKSTKTLRRFCDGELLWVSEIPVNYVDTYYLSYQFNYPDKTFPQGLIAVQNGSELYMFYKETGEYYGNFKIKCGYERV